MRQQLGRMLEDRGECCSCIRCREVGGTATREEIDQAQLVTREYTASGGLEVFISIESPDRKKIFGFCRVRICTGEPQPQDTLPIGKRARERAKKQRLKEESESTRSTSPERTHSRARSKSPFPAVPEAPLLRAFPELAGAALVRELHVYGQMTPSLQPTTENSPWFKKDKHQHVGFGSRMMKKAEEVAWKHKKTQVAVISGVGVRGYYRHLGYYLDEGKGEFMMKDLIVPRWMQTKKAFSALDYVVIFVVLALLSSVVVYSKEIAVFILQSRQV